MGGGSCTVPTPIHRALLHPALAMLRPVRFAAVSRTASRRLWYGWVLYSIGIYLRNAANTYVFLYLQS